VISDIRKHHSIVDDNASQVVVVILLSFLFIKKMVMLSFYRRGISADTLINLWVQEKLQEQKA